MTAEGVWNLEDSRRQALRSSRKGSIGRMVLEGCYALGWEAVQEM